MAGADAPPPYAPVEAAGPALQDDLPPGEPGATFPSLNPAPGPADPQSDSCLAHLKLLFAFQNLREDVGYTDGLWGLWDTRAEGNMTVTAEGEVQEDSGTGAKVKDPKEQLLVLSKIREKRWALYVARAVDRYEAWWKAIADGPRLTQEFMQTPNSPLFEDFPKGHDSKYWQAQSLPPLDVLMVLHSHMLNPHNFLEDCLRAGHRRLWRSGLPWDKINSAIDADFNYDATDEDKARWVETTGRAWENTEDPITKILTCPVCSTRIHVPWTTCGLDEHPKTSERPGLVGSGYGDGKLDTRCDNCATVINKEFLSVAKFCRDARDLLTNDYPMPGTIINPTNGEPERYNPPRYSIQRDAQTFPNRMIQLVLRISIQELVSTPSLHMPPTMNSVRDLVEQTLQDQRSLRAIEQPPTLGRVRLAPVARLSVRKMMSRYWENFSPFALDLCGAVMRQGIFSEKMYKIDWLHAPTARDTMVRLCEKYKRFLSIMGRHPAKVAVPTLDVDLAWHTHQLSPSAYFAYTKAVAKTFVRHDDKIEEDKLQDSFEWTSKVYQETYGEVYSECTCWYCESVRTSHISTIGKVFGKSNNEKISEAFYTSGTANLCPPNNSAHMSAHNAVRSTNFLSAAEQKVFERHSQVHQRRLEENYQKARKRAEKKGRTLPPRDQYYDHWGYTYYMYGPWMYPLWFTPGLYYAWDPGYAVSGGAGWGACATGSCGGGVAAGACGSAGGCAAGGCGGAGGACGGGGGGCGGGGGGGGCGGC
ncbi:hypothetical protein BGZ63DRAFT_431370 [Mariannaea sp. PMI_226]|nr:hypothetical protein BGZ63DRAFT_431370 [Mariannaea sp. PMI_226]